MMWEAFPHYGRSRVAVLSGKQKAEDFFNVLDKIYIL